MSNIDKVAPGVEVELGGKVRRLVFDMWAFYLLEKATGKNALTGDIFMSPSATDIVTLVWAALQHEEKVTLEEVGKMLALHTLPALTAAIQQAFEQVAIPADALKKSTPVESEPVAQ